MKDVAARCGVSIKTVSNVVNNHPNVSKPVRAKVQAAIAELNFAPNSQARALVAKQGTPVSPLGYRIGCVLRPGMLKHDDPYLRLVFRGFEREVRRLRHHLAFIEDLSLLEESWRRNYLLSSQTVDGLISFAGPSDKAGAGNHSLPTVFVGQQPGRDCVTSDKRTGIELLLQHLLGAGHQRIAFVGGDDQRLATFRAVARDPSCATVHFDEFLHGFGLAAGLAAATKVVDLALRPTAALCASDMTAIGFIHGLLDAGLRVPKDMSVTGYDNITESTIIHPPLTTVDTHAEAIGAAAVRLLVERIALPADGAEHTIMLPVTLVSRRSVGSVPAGDGGGR